MANNQNRTRGRFFCLVLLSLLLLFSAFPAGAESAETIIYEGNAYPRDAEYIDLGDFVVTDFDAFTAFLDRMPALRQVDMWQNRMTSGQCDMLAARYPGMRWGWTMVIKNWNHEHLIRTDATSWSTLHNNKSAKHSSEDLSVLKYCWNLMALDVGHNKIDSLEFLYDLPNLRVLILACNAVTDITPIATLQHLEYAELFNNKITDITPLKDLPHLMDLNLGFNRIADLSPLENIRTLQRLWLFSSQRINKAPDPQAVEALRAVLPDAQIDTVHHPTTGTWRYVSGNRKHPHYAAIVQMFGEDHLHPRYEYVPFEDSWTPEGTAVPVETPSPVAEGPALPLNTPQDFSDKGYLLPVDFSAGKAPKPEGYISGHEYTDSTISVQTGEGNTGSCDYWYARIQLTDASQIRTMAASRDGSFRSFGQMDALRLSGLSGAVVAVNGDCWNSSEKKNMGYIIRQGVLYQNNLGAAGSWDSILMDVLLIDEDGDFTVLKKPTEGKIPGLLNGKRVLNAFSFGPLLAENGEVVKNYHEADFWLDMAADKARQRMCIFQTGPLQYLVLCCAGPYKDNAGMTLRELAELAVSLGAKTAYNLDGGYSTLLYFNGARLNECGSREHRRLQDIIYFASAE